MTYVTCRLTAKNRDQLRNPTLGNRVWATFNFYSPYRARVCVLKTYCSWFATQKTTTWPVHSSALSAPTPTRLRLLQLKSPNTSYVASLILGFYLICLAGVVYILVQVWQTCFQLLCTVCLEQVTAIHPISQQFQLIQISSRNPPVCSPLISTVLLPHSDHPRLRFKPCTWLLRTLSSVCMCMYYVVTVTHAQVDGTRTQLPASTWEEYPCFIFYSVSKWNWTIDIHLSGLFT